MRNVFRLSLPFTVWIIGFCAVYALQGLSCSRHWPEGVDPRLALIIAAGAFVVTQGLVLAVLLGKPSPSRFVQATTTTLGAAALAAALWTSLPVLALTVCG
ncbi:hypothetical protein [Tabrizicola sp.]|uniref:hypothetical protein n=1 Tax=Tabrizicola sp. TaxID=2005166 RepID=UPI0035B02969